MEPFFFQIFHFFFPKYLPIADGKPTAVSRDEVAALVIARRSSRKILTRRFLRARHGAARRTKSLTGRPADQLWSFVSSRRDFEIPRFPVFLALHISLGCRSTYFVPAYRTLLHHILVEIVLAMFSSLYPIPTARLFFFFFIHFLLPSILPPLFPPSRSLFLSFTFPSPLFTYRFSRPDILLLRTSHPARADSPLARSLSTVAALAFPFFSAPWSKPPPRRRRHLHEHPR